MRLLGTESNKKSEGFRIDAVARLTGLTADKLRVSEQRYQAVTAARTSSECESRNARDAALHSYLNETAARARYMI